MRSWIENELIELINLDQFKLSIPIQFQFEIYQFNSNSIHAHVSMIWPISITKLMWLLDDFKEFQPQNDFARKIYP